MKKYAYALAVLVAFLLIIAVTIYGFIGGAGGFLPRLPLEKLNIIGEYKYAGEDKYYPLDEHTIFEQNTAKTIVFEGHFDKDVPLNYTISMRAANAKLRLFINDEQVFAFGEDGTFFNYSKSPGNVFVSFISPKISKQDKIVLQITNAYPNFLANAANDVINETYMGFSETLIKDKFSSYGLMFFSSIVMLGFAFALLFAIIILTIKGGYKTERFYYLFGLMLSVSARLFMSFQIVWVFLPNFVFNNLIAFWSLPSALIMFVAYIRTFLTVRIRRYFLPIFWLSLASVPLLIALSFFGYDVFYYQPLLALFVLIVASFCILFLLFEIFCLKNSEARSIAVSIAILTVFSLLEIFLHGARLVAQNVILLYGTMLFFAIQFISAVNTLIKTANKAKEALRLENELIQTNISLLLQQIQPHYIANTLSVISGLCDSNSAIVKSSIEHFAHFFRDNIDSITDKKPIPFIKELTHIEHYMFLEKLGFDDKLHFTQEITAKYFLVPTLSIQPLVENAVRHGIAKNREGGTVNISTKETKDSFVICVTDNGTGFDVRATLGTVETNSENSHIGLQSVRKRLQDGVGGSLTIESVIGAGTTATVTIPKISKELH